MENSEDVIPRLNDELLKKPRVNPDDPPKRNTKDALIDRILLMAEENNLEIIVSNTKLKRMSKPALQKLLGEMLNECMKKQIAEAVKAPGTDDNVIAFATLRMMHDMCVMGVEKGLAKVRLQCARVSRFHEEAYGEQVCGSVSEGDCRGERRAPVYRVAVRSTGDRVDHRPVHMYPTRAASSKL